MADQDRRERIGVFGGTFDPIHIGHLLIAEHAREQLSLDKVVFIPAFISPLKTNRGPTADAKQRLEMVRLACGGNAAFEVDDRELNRGGPSYTIETLRELVSERPERDLVFLMGADSLLDFDKWKEPAAICQTAFVVILARGGYPAPDVSLLTPFLPEAEKEGVLTHVLKMPQVEISSTDLRKRAEQSLSLRYQLHPAVEAFIRANEIYSGKE